MQRAYLNRCKIDLFKNKIVDDGFGKRNFIQKIGKCYVVKPEVSMGKYLMFLLISDID